MVVGKKYLSGKFSVFCRVLSTILLWSYGAKIGRGALMPSSWDVLASPSKSTNFWCLLLYPLTFLDHHVIFICRMLLMSASSCTQVILPVGFM